MFQKFFLKLLPTVKLSETFFKHFKDDFFFDIVLWNRALNDSAIETNLQAKTNYFLFNLTKKPSEVPVSVLLRLCQSTIGNLLEKCEKMKI